MNKLMKSMAFLAVACASMTATADKPVMAVAEFSNTSGAGWWRGGVGTELADMLTNELVSTDAFRMVERKKLGAVLTEQDLGASGRVEPSTAAKIGKMTGAKYLVTGTVSAYESDVSGTGAGISFGGFSVGGKKENAYMAIDLRVVDTTTGEIVDTRTVEGYSKGGGLRLGMHKWGVGGSLAQEKKTPAGKAIRAAIIESSNYLECSMVKKDSCMDDFDAKEQRRRDSAAGALELE